MKISYIIAGWYEKNKRDLPWRSTSDSYRIWLSEIILQQTRVNQGLQYYLRFVERWPDVKSLAAADEEAVLKAWQGLGYYTRARNLHFAARQVVDDYEGVFPCSYDALLKLKGVGKYTAAAVASIACDEAVSLVDGNVSRVLARLFAVEEPINRPAGEQQITALAEALLDRDAPGNHNQALMEFGALQCTPVSPDCSQCPLQLKCEAFRMNRVSDLPRKERNRPSKARYFYYFIIRSGQEIYMQQRQANDIWQKLYEFPLLETQQRLKEEEIVREAARFAGRSRGKMEVKKISEEVKHILTHRTIYARFIHLEAAEGAFAKHSGDWVKVSENQLDTYPVPRLIERYLEQMK